MASNSQSDAGKAQKSASPVSAHPAFPLVVALWFAALLGLGSLVLPVALIESLVSVTGLAELIPAAAPPLGITARIAVALLGTVVGGSLGLFAARSIARSPAEEQPRRRSFKADVNPRRAPLSPREELGSESFDSVAGFATSRRRALAGEEEEGKSDLFQPAPPTHPTPEPAPSRGFAYAEQAPDSLDLDDRAEFTELQEPPLHLAAPEEAIATTKKQVFPVVPNRPAISDPLPFSPPSMARQAPPIADVEGESAEFESEHETPREEFVAPLPEETIGAAEMSDAPTITEPAGPEEAVQQDDEPGLTQLVQKLGTTLEKHREWNAQRRASQLAAPQLAAPQLAAPQFPRAVPAPAFAAPAFGERGADMAEAAQGMAAFFAPEPADAPQIVAAPEGATVAEAREVAAPASVRQLRPFAGLAQIEDNDDDELDQLAASFSLPIHRAEAAKLEPVPDHQPRTTPAAIKNPFRNNRPEFVLVDEPQRASEATLPAVVFPNEETVVSLRAFDRPEPTSGFAASAGSSTLTRPSVQRPSVTSDDNDRVLREALMNLQRIGKI